MRPPSVEEENLPLPPTLKQVIEMKRKKASSSPNLKKPKKKSTRKHKGNTIALSLDSVHRLRDDSEEEEEDEETNLVARVRAGSSIQKPSVSDGVPELRRVEATPSRAEVIEKEIGAEASWVPEDFLRVDLRTINIFGSSQILDAMIREANMLESRYGEGPWGEVDIHDFLDGVEFAALGDVTGFGDLPVPMNHWHQMPLDLHRVKNWWIDSRPQVLTPIEGEI